MIESSVNLIAEGTKLEGKFTFREVSRVHGVLIGEVNAEPGSTLVLAETAVVEGNILADTLHIDGYVRGDITIRTRLVVSGTGRVIGNIRTPSLRLEPGAYFEGRCFMDEKSEKPGKGEKTAISDRSLKPA